MLPPDLRLHRSTDFTEVVRRGRRSSTPCLTVHALLVGEADPKPSIRSARAGLVVSKAVGNAVVRHRTSRRLRALLAGRLAAAPAGARLVVRAHARAGTASSQLLGRDLDSALSRALT